jgi:hypothetical protein
MNVPLFSLPVVDFSFVVEFNKKQYGAVGPSFCTFFGSKSWQWQSSKIFIDICGTITSIFWLKSWGKKMAKAPLFEKLTPGGNIFKFTWYRLFHITFGTQLSHEEKSINFMKNPQTNICYAIQNIYNIGPWSQFLGVKGS